jgi:hypothetical protein
VITFNLSMHFEGVGQDAAKRIIDEKIIPALVNALNDNMGMAASQLAMPTESSCGSTKPLWGIVDQGPLHPKMAGRPVTADDVQFLRSLRIDGEIDNGA